MSRRHLALLIGIFLRVDSMPAQEAKPRRLDGPRGNVLALTFSGDGKQLAATGSGATFIWDVATGKQVRQFDSVTGWSVCFTGDGKRVAVPVGTIVGLHDIATGQPVRQFEGHAQHVWSADCAGTTLAVASSDGTIHLWDTTTGKELRRLNGTDDGAWPVAFARDGRHVAVGGSSGVLALWDAATGKKLWHVPANDGGIWPVVFAPNGRSLATTRWQGTTVKLWETASGAERGSFEVGAASGAGIAIFPDGRSILGSVGPGALVQLDVLAGERRRFKAPTEQAVQSVAVAPDGRTVAGGFIDGAVFVWSVPRELLKKSGTPADTLDKLWASLGSTDGVSAFRAGLILSERAELAIPFLRERLRAADAPAKVDVRRIAGFIALLDDDDFGTRENASRELESIGPAAHDALKAALDRNPTAETRRRILVLLEKFKPGPVSLATLRAVRAIEVLERCGTPAARELLETLAQDNQPAMVRVEAKAALAEIKRRVADTD